MREKEIAMRVLNEIRSKVPNFKQLDYLRLEAIPRKAYHKVRFKSHFIKQTLPEPWRLKFPNETFFNRIKIFHAGEGTKDDHMWRYIFPDKSELPEIAEITVEDPNNIIFANQSESAARLIATDLADRAKNLLEIWLQGGIWKSYRCFLLGIPGVGKTSLIQYVLAVNDDVFHSRNVMAIWVDLNKIGKKTIYGHTPRSLKTQILKDFLRVYRTHYWGQEVDPYRPKYIPGPKTPDGKYVCRPNMDDLIRFARRLEDLPTNDKICILVRKILPNLNPAEKFYEDYKNFEKSEFGKVSDLFSIFMMAYLEIEANVGYVFFVDGLDYATQGESTYPLFNEWCSGALSITESSSKPPRGAFMFVMRKHSFSRAGCLRTDISGSNTYDVNRVYQIVQCSLDEVALKQLEHGLKDSLKTLQLWKKGKTKKHEQLKWLNEKVFNRMIESYKLLLYMGIQNTKRVQEVIDSGITDDNWHDRIEGPGFHELQRVSAGNYRHIAKSMQLLWASLSLHILPPKRLLRMIDWPIGKVAHEMLKHHYRVKRIFISGFRARTAFTTDVHLRVDENNKLEVTGLAQRYTIPNVFHYVSESKYRKPKLKRQFRSLAKIHVLRLLRDREMTKDNIIEILTQCFGYDAIGLELDLSEMYLSGLLSLDIPFDEILEPGEEANWRTSTLGMYLMDTLLDSFIYWETISDDIPLPAAVYKHITPIYLQLEDVDIYKYVVRKCHSVLTILKALEVLSLEEETFFGKKIGHVDSVDAYVSPDDFQLVSTWQKNVECDMLANVIELYHRNSEGLFEALKSELNIEFKE